MPLTLNLYLACCFALPFLSSLNSGTAGLGGSTHNCLALLITHFLLTPGLIELCSIPVWGLLARGFHRTFLHSEGHA